VKLSTELLFGTIFIEPIVGYSAFIITWPEDNG
jgi:hypothetical protein